jgi:hypothetical protein
MHCRRFEIVVSEIGDGVMENKIASFVERVSRFLIRLSGSSQENGNNGLPSQGAKAVVAFIDHHLFLLYL